MNKLELNKYAITYVQEAFIKQGYQIEESSLPASQVNFNAVSSAGKRQNKQRSLSQAEREAQSGDRENSLED